MGFVKEGQSFEQMAKEELDSAEAAAAPKEQEMSLDEAMKYLAEYSKQDPKAHQAFAVIVREFNAVQDARKAEQKKG